MPPEHWPPPDCALYAAALSNVADSHISPCRSSQPAAIERAQVQFWAPKAGGGGVTLVMAFLNGNAVPDLLTPRTLAAKYVGVLCGCASGLAIGPEGPMVQPGRLRRLHRLLRPSRLVLSHTRLMTATSSEQMGEEACRHLRQTATQRLSVVQAPGSPYAIRAFVCSLPAAAI